MIERGEYLDDEDWANYQLLAGRTGKVREVSYYEDDVAVTVSYERLPLLVVAEKVDAATETDRYRRERLYERDREREREANRRPQRTYFSSGRGYEHFQRFFTESSSPSDVRWDG